MDDKPRQDASIPALFTDLLRDISTLMRREVDLAKAEAAAKMSQAGRGATAIAIGGGLAFAGLLFVLLAITYGLAELLPAWAAALIVGLVVLAIGAIMLRSGQKRLKPGNLTPERTVHSLKDDADFVKRQVRG